MSLVTRVAPSEAPVLVMGETGVGKEGVACNIHERSSRRAGPLIKVNCGAIPSELVDSELFGHERGSFTGAIAARKGWFERADRGTLFLDEVGELPPAAQVRLLRVMQDGTFERVGGQRTLTVSVRVIAATHRDLSGMVRNGRFRRDLWYRLSIFPLEIPALRDRRDDIPALATCFAGYFSERLLGLRLTPTEQDLTQLINYPWPGNVRELAAVIERATLLGGGRQLCIREALEVGAQQHHVPSFKAPAPTSNPSDAVRSLETVMIEHIERALQATGGRIEGLKGAGALLGLNPHTLRAKMRKLGIDWSRFR
jgi:transcriptional regulator with GAF, ATPase, and Fis domain